MASKEQKRGNREVRKPKQPKAKPAVASPYVSGTLGASKGQAPSKKK